MRNALVIAGLVALSSCGGGGTSGGGAGGGSGGGVTNRAPTFSSPANVTYHENTLAPAYIASAVDPDGDPLIYAKAAGGADNQWFFMRRNGEFYFDHRIAGNYESTPDVGGNNVYDLLISVTDGKSDPVIQAVQITVANGPEYHAGGVASGLIPSAYSYALTAAVAANDGSGRIYTAESAGVVRIFTPGQPEPRPIFMDLQGTSPNRIAALAPAPDFASSGRFFVLLRSNTQFEVRSYYTVAGNRNQIDLTTGDIIFQTTASCCDLSGWMGFGPDNLLYIAVPVGSSQAAGEAQQLTSLHGKIIRIDVTSDAFPGDPARDYAIPVTNPYATVGGLPEIFVRGVQNPYSGHFDATTGNLYFIDPPPANGAIELNVIRPTDGGRDYGYPTCQNNAPIPSCPGTELPVFRCITAAGNCGNLTAGLLYRGPFAEWDNAYLFADLGTLGAIENRLLQVGSPIPRELSDAFRSLPGFTPLTFGPSIVSMIQSDTQALYLIGGNGDIYQVHRQ